MLHHYRESQTYTSVLAVCRSGRCSSAVVKSAPDPGAQAASGYSRVKSTIYHGPSVALEELYIAKHPNTLSARTK
jgi:hypothetical protein